MSRKYRISDYRQKLNFYVRNLKLGELYEVTHESPLYFSKSVCRFVRVTNKGFNFLIVSGQRIHKCFLLHHLYSPNFSKIDMPTQEQLLQLKSIPFYIPEHITAKTVKEEPV